LPSSLPSIAFLFSLAGDVFKMSLPQLDWLRRRRPLFSHTRSFLRSLLPGHVHHDGDDGEGEDVGSGVNFTHFAFGNVRLVLRVLRQPGGGGRALGQRYFFADDVVVVVRAVYDAARWLAATRCRRRGHRHPPPSWRARTTRTGAGARRSAWLFRLMSARLIVPRAEMEGEALCCSCWPGPTYGADAFVCLATSA